MYLDLQVDRPLVIAGFHDPRACVVALPLLLDPADTVVFGAYGSRPDITAFLTEHQIPADHFVRDARRLFAINRSEYPEANAYPLSADPRILRELADLIRNVAHSTDFCDHVVAYSSRCPILCYRDAFKSFKSPSCLISSEVPESRVEAFCSALSATCTTQLFPEPPPAQAQ